MTESLGGIGIVYVGEPYVAHACCGGRAPALVLQAGGDLVLPVTSGATSIQGEADEESETDMVFIFYFLNNAFSGALCWGL